MLVWLSNSSQFVALDPLSYLTGPCLKLPFLMSPCFFSIIGIVGTICCLKLALVELRVLLA